MPVIIFLLPHLKWSKTRMSAVAACLQTNNTFRTENFNTKQIYSPNNRVGEGRAAAGNGERELERANETEKESYNFIKEPNH